MSDRNLRKTRVGIVSSDKMDKTIVVSVVEHVKHPLYGKIMNLRTSVGDWSRLLRRRSNT